MRLITILFTIGSPLLYAQEQWYWAKNYELFYDASSARYIATTEHGSTYLTGYRNFPPKAFFLHLDTVGRIIKNDSVAVNDNYTGSLVCDKKGGLYRLHYGGIVAKYNYSLELIWSQQIPGVQFHNLAVNPEFGITICGRLVGAGIEEGVACGIDSAGAVLWQTSLGMADLWALSTDSSGNTCIAGYSYPPKSSSNSTPAACILDKHGKQSYFFETPEISAGVATTTDQCIYTISQRNNYDTTELWIRKMTFAGELLWENGYTVDWLKLMYGMCGFLQTDQYGYLYICGNFGGKLAAGTEHQLESKNSGFILKVSPEGKIVWSKKAEQHFWAYEYNPYINALTIAGSIPASANFDTISCTVDSYADAFAARIFPPIHMYQPSTVKIEEIKSTDIGVYPVPSDGAFTISGVMLKPEAELIIANSTGAQVNFQVLQKSTNKIQIDLQGNTPGIYLLVFRNGADKKVAKLLLQ